MADREPLEAWYKAAASLYAEKEGERYQREAAVLETENRWHTQRLDKLTGRKLARIKYRKYVFGAVPAAAAFFIMLYWLTVPMMQKSADLLRNTTVQHRYLPAITMPVGFTVTGINYDHEKTMYYIESDAYNLITLCIASSVGQVQESPFQEIWILDTKAHIWVKKDYSILMYEKDGWLYTLTSPYDYRDLIILSEALL